VYAGRTEVFQPFRKKTNPPKADWFNYKMGNHLKARRFNSKAFINDSKEIIKVFINFYKYFT